MTQPLEALALANKVRYARANLKRQIHNGELNAADVLRDVPPLVDTMPLIELLLAQFKWGPHRARRLLRAVSVPDSKTIGAMTCRQRHLVAALLDGDDEAIRDAELDRSVERWLIERGRGQAA
jgi:hypothetical protein